jgi:sn-glycerol 3-phosphate transport system substrate-binding protein
MRCLTGTRLAAWAAALALAAGAASPAWAGVELTMYYPVAVGGPVTKIVDGLVADFGKEHPDITVNAIYAGNYDDTRVKALAALKAGQPAQLSVLFSIDLFELVEQDAIVPFDDLVQTAEDRAWLKSFFPAFMENGVLRGKTWGIPFQRSTIVMYWNKAAFREAGLDPERPPATWADLVETGKRLVKRDAAGQVQRWGVMIPSTGYPYWMFQALALQNGQVLMNPEGNRTFFDAPPVVEALQYWADLGKTQGVMPQGTVEWGTLRQQFLEGKTGIMWHTTGNLTAVKSGAQFDFGVAMLPAKARRGSPTGGGNFYVFKKTTPEERKAALTFVKWITAPERAARWSIDTGYVAVRPDAYDTPVLRKYVEGFPAAAVARDQLKFATAELSTYEGGRVRKALDDAIQAVLTGAKTPKDALGAAQQQAERLLRRYR